MRKTSSEATAQLSEHPPMDCQRKWYIMLSNDWGQFNRTALGLHCLTLITSTLVWIPKSQSHRNSLGCHPGITEEETKAQKSDSKNWFQRIKPTMWTALVEFQTQIFILLFRSSTQHIASVAFLGSLDDTTLGSLNTWSIWLPGGFSNSTSQKCPVCACFPHRP